MTAINQSNILFDDVSLLAKQLGQAALTVSSPATDCDCIGYTSTNDDNVDTDQITATPGQVG